MALKRKHVMDRDKIGIEAVNLYQLILQPFMAMLLLWPLLIGHVPLMLSIIPLLSR